MILPLEHKGVKMISLGFVSPKVSHDLKLFTRTPLENFIYLFNKLQSGVPGSGRSGGAAIMRGPMAGKVVTQL